MDHERVFKSRRGAYIILGETAIDNAIKNDTFIPL
jgi:hypothetical protein